MFLEVLTIGAFAGLFSTVLTSEGNIFSFWGRVLSNLLEKREWLAKPLGFCAKCFGGQIALWYYVVRYYEDYWVLDHFCFVVWSILFSIGFEFLLNKTQ